MAAESKVCDFGWKARDFRLPGTDGRTYSLADIKGAKGAPAPLRRGHFLSVQASGWRSHV